MTDLEKAKTILEILNKQKYELEGVQDAFKLTQAYSWLFLLVKQMEEKEKVGGNKRRQSTSKG